MKTNTYLWSYLAQFFFEWEVFQAKFVEDTKHIFYFHFFLIFSSVR